MVDTVVVVCNGIYVGSMSELVAPSSAEDGYILIIGRDAENKKNGNVSTRTGSRKKSTRKG